MLGFLYLILILGWMLIVIFLKCKKTVIPHILGHYARYNNENIDVRNQAVPSVHIIQLPAYEQYLHNSPNYSQTYPIDAVRTYSRESMIYPPCQHQDEFMLNAPPPTYEEVMRQPEVYPKVQKDNASVIEIEK